MQIANNNFEMIRGADVTIDPILGAADKMSGDRKIQGLNLRVDGRSHSFNASSGLVRQLKAVTTHELEDRLSGGNFFFVNDKLMDFRPGDYTGFVQTDQGIDTLMENLGTLPRSKGHYTRSITPGYNRNEVMGRAWSPETFEVPGMGRGGEFKSVISFVWNPFYRDIHTHVGVERLVCLNGMTATADVMNYAVPMVNDWQEGLEIAHRRLSNKLQSIVLGGLENAAYHRASVATVGLLNDHVMQRIKSPTIPARMRDLRVEQIEAKLREQNARLRELAALTDVRTNLKSDYRLKVFDNRSIGKMLPSHLTAFDAFNIATELSSHSEEAQYSSNSALNGIANGIVFQGSEKKSQSAFADTPTLSDFNDHDMAFMGAGEIANR